MRLLSNPERTARERSIRCADCNLNAVLSSFLSRVQKRQAETDDDTSKMPMFPFKSASRRRRSQSDASHLHRRCDGSGKVRWSGSSSTRSSACHTGRRHRQSGAPEMSDPDQSVYEHHQAERRLGMSLSFGWVPPRAARRLPASREMRASRPARTSEAVSLMPVAFLARSSKVSSMTMVVRICIRMHHSCIQRNGY